MNHLKHVGDRFAEAIKPVKESLEFARLALPNADDFRVKLPDYSEFMAAKHGKQFSRIT